MRKVKIKALPKKLTQAKDGHETKAKLWNGDQQNWPTTMNEFSLPQTTAGRTLQPVDRKDANLEAEKGETAIVNQDGIPTNFNIGGKRHSEGGTPLNLPSNSFIFSDTKDMKIKDKTILDQFNASKGMTPADISKKYDINKFRGTLADPDSTDLQRKTAEMMIANYNMKLAKLSLVQESKKGFPQGVPSIAMPYIESTGMDPNSFFQTQAQPEQFNADMGNAQTGGSIKIPQFKYDTSGIDAWTKKQQEERAQKEMLENLSVTPNWFGQIPNKDLESSFLDFARTKEGQDRAKDKAASKHYIDSLKVQGSVDKAYKFDEQIKDKLAGLERIQKMSSHYNPSSVEKAIKDVQREIIDLKAKQDEALKFANTHQQKMVAPFGFKTKEEYQASLLTPFTPEKRAAQVAWNLANPGGYHNVEEKKKELVKPSVAVSDTTGLAAFKSMQQGGELEEYDGGGKVVKKSDKFIQYEDGSIKNIASGNFVQHAKPDWKAPVTKTGVKQGSPSEIPIYNQTTEEWIKAQKAAGKNVILPKVIPPGSFRIPVQHGVKDQKNIYGKVRWTPEEQADFKARHPWIYKERPNWDPSNDEDVTWAQTEYSKMNPGYFNQKDTKGNPIRGTGIDSDFGAHTFSMPGISDAEKAAAEDKGIITAATGDAKKKVAAAALATAQQPGHDPWWLQDIVKTAGAAGDFFRVKKYAPWQATPGVTLPDPTFYDPTRELAANAEMANLGVQGANAFTNPQAYAAAFSQIQGQGAKNAADILGKYNQMNVGVANDFEIKRTDIMNQASANRAGLSTQLADKYAIMNQQFDNSKNMARQNLRQSYIDAVTNKNYTGNLNDLYDQYKIDPSTGGRIRWTHGRPITPEDTDQDMISKVNATALALRKQNPGLDPDKAVEHAIKLHSAGASGNKMYGQEAMGYPGGQGQGPGQ